MDAERFVVDRVRRMSAYAPITPVETIARRIGAAASGIVKLDANENHTVRVRARSRLWPT